MILNACLRNFLLWNSMVPSIYNAKIRLLGLRGGVMWSLCCFNPIRKKWSHYYIHIHVFHDGWLWNLLCFHRFMLLGMCVQLDVPIGLGYVYTRRQAIQWDARGFLIQHGVQSQASARQWRGWPYATAVVVKQELMPPPTYAETMESRCCTSSPRTEQRQRCEATEVDLTHCNGDRDGNGEYPVGG